MDGWTFGIDGRCISRRLVQQDPSNAEWQRDLAVALVKIARLTLGGGKGRQAVPFLREAKAVFEKLVALAPDHTGWKAELETVALELLLAERGRQDA